MSVADAPACRPPGERVGAHVVALVPLNAPSAAKSRLGGALDETERRLLARWLAERVIMALRTSGALAEIGVISPDDDILAWARTVGAHPLRQVAGGLNDGLALGQTWARDLRADALLIALGDLPLLTADEVAAFVHCVAPSERGVALAPDRVEQGTNLLVARPAALAPLAFGEGSFARHVALARRAGVEPRIFRSLGTSFDVDTPSDLMELRARSLWPPSAQASAAPISPLAPGVGAGVGSAPRGDEHERI